mmetsp:Transcript_1951/g.5167  ORF Transcript_1951/g.5167 Transcript_1951/m.5167 type:complete len:216 (-) Transcript_1951:851-1498(-)
MAPSKKTTTLSIFSPPSFPHRRPVSPFPTAEESTSSGGEEDGPIAARSTGAQSISPSSSTVPLTTVLEINPHFRDNDGAPPPFLFPPIRRRLRGRLHPSRYSETGALLSLLLPGRPAPPFVADAAQEAENGRRGWPNPVSHSTLLFQYSRSAASASSTDECPTDGVPPCRDDDDGDVPFEDDEDGFCMIIPNSSSARLDNFRDIHGNRRERDSSM